MLVSYLNAIEKVLLAKSNAASIAGHPNLRGGPREWFIEEFLANHLPSLWEVGQGEIISEKSVPKPTINEYRNQNDLVIYRRDFPKISYSPRDKGYLVEGVVATLEIKSKINAREFGEACKASRRCKSQISEIETGLGLRVRDNIWEPSHIISYVVAYDGPKSVSIIAKWLEKIAKELNVQPNFLVDMIIVLGKGVVWRINAFPAYKIANMHKEGCIWAYVEQKEKNIYTLFSHMLTIGKISSSPPRISAYIRHLPNSGVKTIG